MKIAVALFMLAVAASVPQVKGQNWMMNYLMMQNLLGDSTSQSAGANTAAGAGTTGTPSPTGSGFDLSALVGGGQQSNPLFRMNAMTGGFGDQMQDLTYCSMLPRGMQQICMFRAMGMM
ncbi:uncharacterized protein LOC127831650 [Dreissena polymorpha]|uniref:Uncharacterized protein n=1 Tax=Dreissena polymorpha TaxID=45954 RepID=A0A9D4K227_DREPO|nr:uncharacterized protein LOC127831650 [Dreissena polymorpha]KAH3828933.1 hypothetical protein DPMN_130918 [Dreissena polymorpha]